MSELLTERDAPQGFHPSASGSGLVVPEELARERETWTRDEWRLIDRLMKIMRSRNLAVTLHCNDERCKGAEIEVLQGGAGFSWQCKHKTRVFHRQI